MSLSFCPKSKRKIPEFYSDIRALLVAINYYGTSNRLHGCINDSVKIEALLSKLGFSNNDMTILRDGNTVHSAPTRQNILKHLSRMIASEATFLFFHYSGHGSHIRDTNGDEADGRDECICPSSGGWIVDDEIRKQLDKLRSDQTIFMLFDCCHSGTVADLAKEFYINQKNFKLRRVTNQRVKSTTGKVITLSGCKDDQTSADAWEENESQGAMTYAFRKAFAKPKVKCYRDLVRHVNAILKHRGYKQRSVLCLGRFEQKASDRCFWVE